MEEIVGGMHFDLVYLENAPAYLVKRIKEKGKRYACDLIERQIKRGGGPEIGKLPINGGKEVRYGNHFREDHQTLQVPWPVWRKS
jgi:hypothetical protein